MKSQKILSKSFEENDWLVVQYEDRLEKTHLPTGYHETFWNDGSHIKGGGGLGVVASINQSRTVDVKKASPGG